MESAFCIPRPLPDYHHRFVYTSSCRAYSKIQSCQLPLVKKPNQQQQKNTKKAKSFTLLAETDVTC